MRAAVVASWQEATGEPVPAGDISFFEAGGDSRAAVRLLNGLHTRLGVRMRLRHFFAIPTVDALVEIVIAGNLVPGAHRTPTTIVQRLRHGRHESQRGAADVLWCFFPSVGGRAATYLRIAQLLPPGQEVWACNTPLEREGSELTAMAELLVSALRREGIDAFRQVNLAGYSLGGALVLEAARALAEDGRSPDWLGHVFLLDPTPPGEPPSAEEVLGFFIHGNWRIDDDPRSFLAEDGTLDANRVLRAAHATEMLELTASEQDVSESWAIYQANGRLVDGHRPTALNDRRPWLLRTDAATERGRDAAETSVTPCDDAGPWAFVTTPDRWYRLSVEHTQLLAPGSDAVVARWMGELAQHGEP